MALLTKTTTMNIERIIKEKLGFKYFFTFSEYTDTWACLHADDLKHYYNDKDNVKDLRITYGNTLSECVLNMCESLGIDVKLEKKDGNNPGRKGGRDDLWFEYSTD
jgi:hypothetical protein